MGKYTQLSKFSYLFTVLFVSSVRVRVFGGVSILSYWVLDVGTGLLQFLSCNSSLEETIFRKPRYIREIMFIQYLLFT